MTDSKFTKAEERQLLDWAKRHIRGLDESDVFCGIFTAAGPLDAARVEFTLQLGHALLTGKPIVLTAPYGYTLPPKLLAVAARVVRFDPNNIETLHHGVRRALVELGQDPQ